jgi:hypothetical protein
MLSQSRIKINPSLSKCILNSINNSIEKKSKLVSEKENNLCYKNNIVLNCNISGFVFFLSLSIIHLFFLNKK